MTRHPGDTGVKVNWGYLKEWARDNKIPDSALIAVGGCAVKDLDFYEADTGTPDLYVLLPGKRLY